MSKNAYILLILIVILPYQVSFAQENDPRRNPTAVAPDRVPGYTNESPENNTNSKTIDGQSSSQDSKTVSQESNPSTNAKPAGNNGNEGKPTSTNSSMSLSGPESKKNGFVKGANFIELRGGASLFIDGPVVDNLSKSLRTNGFDSYFTYTYGSDADKALLYSGIQSYKGVEVKGTKFGFLYEKAYTDHWGFGGGLDYREYRVNNVPKNELSRTSIVSSYRFPGAPRPSQEEIARYLGYELAGLSSYANSLVSNRILFLEVNATYHFFNESVFDPYLRPIIGIGYDTTTKGYAGKLGGAAGFRYFFDYGIYLALESSADIVYVAQDKIISSKAKDRFYEISYSFSLGKKFN